MKKNNGKKVEKGGAPAENTVRAEVRVRGAFLAVEDATFAIGSHVRLADDGMCHYLEGRVVEAGFVDEMRDRFRRWEEAVGLYRDAVRMSGVNKSVVMNGAWVEEKKKRA